MTAVAYGDMPLFLFHLLEFMDVDYEIDVDELNERWTQPGQHRRLDAVHPEADRRSRRAASRGARVGDLAHGRTTGDRVRAPRHRLAHRADENEAFYLRIAGAGQYRYPGADLGIFVTRGRFMDDDHELTDRARQWIDGDQGAVPERPASRRQPPDQARAVRLQDALTSVGGRACG